MGKVFDASMIDTYMSIAPLGLLEGLPVALRKGAFLLQFPFFFLGIIVQWFRNKPPM